MTGPDPAVAAVRAAVRAGLVDLPVGPVLVACSGGPDSLALAAATAFLAPRLGRPAGAVVVDHGLQPGSAEVAARAGAQCRALGLDPVEVVAVVPASPSEADARTARYAALTAAADRWGAVAVLLGHSLDDQAEQVLLGLARGSGPRSLAGMAAVRDRLRRPLLGLRRAVLAQACAAEGLTPWADPTNHPDGGGARRAVVRHTLLPALEAGLGPGVAEALARTADQLRADAEVLEALAADLLARARGQGEGGPGGEGGCEGEGGPGGEGGCAADGWLDTAVLAEAPDALRTRALRSALLGWGAAPGSLSAAHVGAVDALVTRWSGQGPAHLPGLVVVRRCGRLGPHSPADPGSTGGRD